MKFVFASIILIFMSVTAFAWCPNYPDISIAEELKRSDFVAVGTVISRFIVVDPVEDPEGYEAEIFKFKIEQTLSGNPKKEIFLYNENNSGRFPMEVGKKYFIFVSTGKNGYWVDSCGNSDEFKTSSNVIAKVKKLLNKAHK